MPLRLILSADTDEAYLQWAQLSAGFNSLALIFKLFNSSVNVLWQTASVKAYMI